MSSLVVALALPSLAAAYPGSLDPSFGGTGTVTTGIAPADLGDTVHALGVQADGKIVTVGTANFGAGLGGDHVAIARFNVDGSLDTSFDSDGKQTASFAPGDNYDSATAVGFEPDGKIVVGGWADMGAGSGGLQFAVARFNTNGSPDTSFDGDGKQTTAIASGDNTDTIYALRTQTDGKIVVGGYSSFSAGSGGLQFSLARYNVNGSLDLSFDTDGRQSTSIAPGDGPDSVHALGLQPDGKIVVSGKASMGAGFGGYQFALARYNANGSLDSSFDGDGKQTTGIATADNEDVSNSLGILPDGRIVAGGYSFSGPGAGGSDFAVARYNADGSLDGSFDNDGKLTTSVAPGDNSDQGIALSLQSDGKIVQAGFSYLGTGAGGYQYTLTRYRANGSLDTDFDGDGKLSLGIAPADGDDVLGALGIQADGRIVIAGYSNMGSGAGTNQIALARFMGGDLPATPGALPAAVPTAKIAKPSRKKTKAKSLKVISGTAGPAGRVAKVEIALRRVDRASLKRGRCLWLRNSKAKFVKTKAKRKRCTTQRFLKAKGTEKWSFKLSKRLPVGSYQLYVRVTLDNGVRHTTFTKPQGNLLAFRVV